MTPTKANNFQKRVDAKLGEVARVLAGYAFPSNKMKTDSGKYQLVKMSNLYQGRLNLDRKPSFIDAIEDRHKKFLLQKGDILITLTGTLGKRDFGYTALVETDSNLLLNQRVCAIRPIPELATSDYLIGLLRDKSFLDQFFALSIGGTGNQANVSINSLKNILISLPGADEQTEVASLTNAWQIAAQKLEKMLAAKELHYSHELSRLISRAKHPSDHVGSFAKEVSHRNHGGNEARVLSVTNSRGFVLPEDHFQRRVASANLSNYKIVRRGQYAYNPSRINVGSIARLDAWDDGVLSPMYIVFQLNEAKISSDYFHHWLNSHEARYRIAKSAQGSVRQTVSFKEFAAIQVPLPNKVHQARIARYLNTLRKEIDLLKAYRDKLQTQKRGLMQKLLTGQLRLPVQEEAN